MYCFSLPSLGKLLLLALFLFPVLPFCGVPSRSGLESGIHRQATATGSTGNGLIQHVVIIMQENRSFHRPFRHLPRRQRSPIEMRTGFQHSAYPIRLPMSA